MDTGRHDLATVLRRAGVRVTAPRLSVLAALADGPSHVSAEAIVTAVRAHVGDTSPQTIYNVLRTLTDAGLVRRIEPAGSPGLYELRVADNHHHVVCRRCGAIADITCAVGAAPCLTAADDSGYEIDEAEIIYWGRCPECVAATSASSGKVTRTRSARHQLGDTALAPDQPRQPRSRAMSHQMETARQEEDRRV
jgi:Fe2+ or Zn2+ uptake regulation protein